MIDTPPPQTFNEWLADKILRQSAALRDIQTTLGALMTQSDQLGADIAELKTNVAAEIQQVIDALAAAAANATELTDLRAAVTQAHTDLTTLNDNLKADDPAAPPTP